MILQKEIFSDNYSLIYAKLQIFSLIMTEFKKSLRIKQL